jgi:hypothetical protein
VARLANKISKLFVDAASQVIFFFFCTFPLRQKRQLLMSLETKVSPKRESSFLVLVYLKEEKIERKQAMVIGALKHLPPYLPPSFD